MNINDIKSIRRGSAVYVVFPDGGVERRTVRTVNWTDGPSPKIYTYGDHDDMDAVCGPYSPDEIEGIPLARMEKPQLVSVGFDPNTCVIWLNDNLYFCKDEDGDIRLGFDEYYVTSVDFLHELQNIYFDITKKELL